MEDYPGSQAEFENRFLSEEACLEYLASIRWSDGFKCNRCKGNKGWSTNRGLWHCQKCGMQVSVTSGTIFHRTRKPMRLWFRAMWHITTQKYGANALGLQRVLGLNSYQTAWAWLHRLRQAMVRPGRDRLSGCIQVDETYIGGWKTGKAGRGARGEALVAIAAENKGYKGIGRIRLQQIEDASSLSLGKFIKSTIQEGSMVQTDDWQGYSSLSEQGYDRQIIVCEYIIQGCSLPVEISG
jgi:hypothetical protein